MREDIDMGNLLISAPYGDQDAYESVSTFWEMDPYIKWLTIDFALESKQGNRTVRVYEDEEKAIPLGSLFGALILGQQAYEEGEDIFLLCDDCDGDLLVVAEELAKEGVIEEDGCFCPNILYIHNLELSSELIEARNIKQFFEMFPNLVFQYTNIKPDLVAYLIADVEGFYEEQARKTAFDSRAVDGFSPLIFSENGYTLSESGNLLYCRMKS